MEKEGREKVGLISNFRSAVYLMKISLFTQISCCLSDVWSVSIPFATSVPRRTDFRLQAANDPQGNVIKLSLSLCIAPPLMAG